MAKDLICDMDVDENTAQWRSKYMGKTYYFCAPGCKKTFDGNPEKYVGKTNPHHTMHHGCCGH